jgi:hypothetical protein
VHELAKVRGELGFRLIGYVVIPEHVYLLIGEPPVGRPSVVPHRLKLRVAKRLGKRKKRVSADQMALPFGKCRDAPRAICQARFYDFNVCSREEEDGKAELHACESSEARTRERSQRIACEAVGALITVKTRCLECTSKNKKRKPQDPGSIRPEPAHWIAAGDQRADVAWEISWSAKVSGTAR